MALMRSSSEARADRPVPESGSGADATPARAARPVSTAASTLAYLATPVSPGCRTGTRETTTLVFLGIMRPSSVYSAQEKEEKKTHTRRKRIDKTSRRGHQRDNRARCEQ